MKRQSQNACCAAELGVNRFGKYLAGVAEAGTKRIATIGV